MAPLSFVGIRLCVLELHSTQFPAGRMAWAPGSGRAGGCLEGEVAAQPSPNQSDSFAEVSGGA